MRSVMTAAVLSLATAGVASAMSISTGAAPWNFTAWTPVVGGSDPLPIPADQPVPQSPAPVITPPNGGWTGLTGDWIGSDANNGSQGVGGLYSYQLTLGYPQLPIGQYVVSGTYSSDNVVVSFLINGQQLVTSAMPGIVQYQTSVPVTVTADTPLLISVVVWNADNYSGAMQQYGGVDLVKYSGLGTDSNDNPTGFILNGSVDPVPLPAAAWGGMSLIGLVAAQQLRKRVKAS